MDPPVQEVLTPHLAKRGEVFRSVSTEGRDHYNKSMESLPDLPILAHHDTQTYFLLKRTLEKVVPDDKKVHQGATQQHTDSITSFGQSSICNIYEKPH
jgi:hypothetical protein